MSIGKRLHAIGRFGVCVLAGVPSTTIIPLPLIVPSRPTGITFSLCR